MQITKDITLRDFEAWSGAVDTKQTIIDAGKVDEFESLIEELFPGGVGETKLNDILSFEDEWLFESLGIDTEEDEDEDE